MKSLGAAPAANATARSAADKPSPSAPDTHHTCVRAPVRRWATSSATVVLPHPPIPDSSQTPGTATPPSARHERASVNSSTSVPRPRSRSGGTLRCGTTKGMLTVGQRQPRMSVIGRHTVVGDMDVPARRARRHAALTGPRGDTPATNHRWPRGWWAWISRSVQPWDGSGVGGRPM